MASLGTPTTFFDNNPSTSVTFSHTVAAGTDLVVVRIAPQGLSSGHAAPNAVTLNGVALTEARSQKNGVAMAQIWYLPAASVPSAGTYTVAITGMSDGLDRIAVVVQNGTGFDATTPLRDADGDNVTNTEEDASDIVLTTVAGDIVLDVLMLRQARTVTKGANQTVDYEEEDTAGFYFSSTTADDTDTTPSWTWTTATQGGAQVAAAFIPASGPPGEVTATLGFHSDGTQKVDVSFSPENSTDDYAIMRRPVTEPESEFVLVGVLDATSDDPAVWPDHAIHDMPAGQYEYTVQRIISEGTYGDSFTPDTVDFAWGGGSQAVVLISATGGGEAGDEGGELSGFLQDACTDTNETTLADHDADVGGGWTKLTGDGEAQILSNKLANLCDSGEQALYVSDATPPSADYKMSAVMDPHSDLSHSIGLCVRMDPNDPAGTFIVGRRKQNNNQWQILEYDGGNATLIDAIVEDFTTAATVELIAQGDTVTLRVGGVVKCQGTTTLLTAGRPGLQILTNSGGSAGTASTGITLDDIEAIGVDRSVTVAQGNDRATGVGIATATFTPASTVNPHRVLRAGDNNGAPDGNWTVLDQVAATAASTASYTDTTGVAGTTYHYTVQEVLGEDSFGDMYTPGSATIPEAITVNFYKKAIQAMGDGELTLESDGTYEVLFLEAGYTVDLADDGDEFEDDLGENISHRETLSNFSWSNRVIDFDNLTVTDPDNGDTVTQIAIVKSGNGSGGAGGGGAAASNRLILHQTLADPVTWDGTNDSLTVSGSGAARIGGA